jgi:hypothetical protein
VTKSWLNEKSGRIRGRLDQNLVTAIVITVPSEWCS